MIGWDSFAITTIGGAVVASTPSVARSTRRWSTERTVMTSPSAEIQVSFHLSWVNKFFLEAFARGYVRVDGQEHTADWRSSTAIPVGLGQHQVEAYLKYKGSKSELGRAVQTVSLAPDSNRARLVAYGSWLNNVPFHFRSA